MAHHIRSCSMKPSFGSAIGRVCRIRVRAALTASSAVSARAFEAPELAEGSNLLGYFHNRKAIIQETDRDLPTAQCTKTPPGLPAWLTLLRPPAINLTAFGNSTRMSVSSTSSISMTRCWYSFPYSDHGSSLKFLRESGGNPYSDRT